MSVVERTAALLDRLRGEDAEALGELFMLYRERLWRMVDVRLERRVASRVAPDDVLQETFLDVALRIGEYLTKPEVPFYVWLRFLALQRLQMMQRAHLGARMRSVDLEVALPLGGPFASSESLADQFVSQMTSPSQAGRTTLPADIPRAPLWRPTKRKSDCGRSVRPRKVGIGWGVRRR